MLTIIVTTTETGIITTSQTQEHYNAKPLVQQRVYAVDDTSGWARLAFGL